MFVGVLAVFFHLAGGASAFASALFLARISQLFPAFSPQSSASVHFGLPQTQHALNFASYHNAAVKLITSLECKNETQAHTKLQYQWQQQSPPKTHRKNQPTLHPHAEAIHTDFVLFAQVLYKS